MVVFHYPAHCYISKRLAIEALNLIGNPLRHIHPLELETLYDGQLAASRRRTLDYALLVVSMTSTTLFQMIGSSASRIGDIVLTPSGDLVLMTVPAHPYDQVWILSILTSISVFVYPTGFSFRSLGGFLEVWKPIPVNAIVIVFCRVGLIA